MQSEFDTPRILVLEDDPDMRRILTKVLEGQGYLVTAVGSGLAAVEEAAKQTFALIVADIRMEGMDGLEALAKTKSYQPEIGSLVVSGYSTPEDTERAAELGVGAYLKKPFRMKRFLEAVRAQLGKVTREEEVQASANLADEALVWALNQHVETVDQEGLFHSPGSLSEIGASGRALAKAVGFNQAQAEQLGLAAQLIHLRETSFSQPPGWLLENSTLVTPLSRALTVDSSKESQVAHLAAHSGELEEVEVAGEIREAYENQELDIEDPDRLLESGPRDTARSGSLLILGRTLAQAGDGLNAQAAYQKALELAQTTEEKIKVRLESLDFGLKDNRSGEEFAQQCEELISIS